MANRGGLSVMLLAPANSVLTARWAAGLAGAGHQVLVASWQPGPQIPGVEVRVAPAAGACLGRRAPRTVTWLRRLTRDARPDVVHVHSLGTHGLLSLALPGGPARVVTPWGSEFRAARSSPARAMVARLALRRADLVLTTSAEVAVEVTSRYAVPSARTRVLSPGVPEELIAAYPSISRAGVRSAFGIPADATVVLSIRSATATYRTSEVVSAFALAAAGRPDLFLVVLSGLTPSRPSARLTKDRYLDQVRSAARAASGRILVVEGALSPLRAFELMCASDVAVSIPPGDQRSASVLEAALAGCHLMLSDIAPYREMIADGLAAQLLAEPIRASLAGALRGACARPSDCRDNQAFILSRERGADKLAALGQIYRQLAADR